MCAKRVIPEDWLIYTGVDLGSGGEKNHPAAVCFIGVRPDFKYGEVFQGWRGDKTVTTSADVLEKHRELCIYHGRQLYPVIKSYDYSNRDFFNISSRAGEGFTPADKNRERGKNLLNTLFKSQMLKIQDDDPELLKLVIEISNLLEDTAKAQAVDDFLDSLRYGCMPIPWNFDGIAFPSFKPAESLDLVDDRSKARKHYDARKAGPLPPNDDVFGMEEEFSEWQELIDG
jgi:hypothetical protein